MVAGSYKGCEAGVSFTFSSLESDRLAQPFLSIPSAGAEDSGIDVNVGAQTAVQGIGWGEAEWKLLVSRLEGTWGKKASCWTSPWYLVFF